MKRSDVILAAALLLLLLSCGGRRKAAAPAVLAERPFPQVSIPSAYTDDDERIAYGVGHYWDGFFEGPGRTDSAHVLGVPKGEVEQALSNYIGVLEGMPLEQAQQHMSSLFDRISGLTGAPHGWTSACQVGRVVLDSALFVNQMMKILDDFVN